MKKKDEKIIITAHYLVDDKEGFKEAAKDCKSEQFSIIDKETILFKSKEHGDFKLHLDRMKDPDKKCFEALGEKDDLSGLQMQYGLFGDKIHVSFYYTRLTNDDIDMTIFDNLSITDVDPKVLVGLFMDNRFHG